MCVINPNYLPIFDVGNNGNFWLKKKEPSQWGPSSPIFSGCLIILFLLVVFRMRNHKQWQYFKVAYYRP